ncbi:division/cell wall cluster transcriptional repressor MraZ [Brevundimonas sp. NPDC092305]|uniref:division/cell wall cluster transcriptional repressor MraZ n=1 Tax=Brevundimonas sp. NPDC092305 TaxID=3363957 RepID=UPI00380D52CB
MFLGTWEKQLDGKRRLQIPQEFRTAVSGVELGVYCLLAVTDDCLEAGGDALTELYEQRIEALPFGSEERDALEEAFYGGQRQLAYDGGGRITLPESLCEAAGLTSDVVVVGKGRRFQIWDRARFVERNPGRRALASRVLKGGE